MNDKLQGFSMSVYVTSLSEFSLLCVEGEDSLAFLQGQLSQDIHQITEHRALLSCYANPKGRVISTQLIWKSPLSNHYYLLVCRDIAVFLQKRLSMFVLRAKVKITLLDAQITGYWGKDLTHQTTKENVHHLLTQAPQSDLSSTKPSFSVLTEENQHFIAYSSERLLHIQLSPSSVEALFTSTTQGDSRHWQAQDILQGMPWVGEKTKELFIAQSINQDAIGAINFRKGCYPGQEVIARSHYLGNLKRRTFIAQLNQEVDAIDEFIASDVLYEQQAVGQVVNACSWAGKTLLLLELQWQNVNDGVDFRLASLPDVSLMISLPPYSLDKPEVH